MDGILLGCVLVSALMLFGCGSTIEHRHVAFDVAPDGKSIVFSSANGDLYRFSLETSHVQRITSTPAIESNPAFSPDGQSIAYTVWHREDGRDGNGIALHPLGGTRVRELTDGRATADGAPCFSPDGTRIAFARAYLHRPYSMGGWTWDDSDVCIMNVSDAAATVTRVTHQEYYGISSPSFFADGKRVIYSASGGGERSGVKSHVFELDVESAASTAEPREFSSDKPTRGKYYAWMVNPRVSRDGSRIVFLSDRFKPYHYDLFIMDVSGADARPLNVVRISRYNQNPVFSPDGRRILFLAGTEFNAGSRAIYSLWQVNVDGSEPRQIAGSLLFTNPEKFIAARDRR